MVTRKPHPKKFFTEQEKDRIVQAIRQAEHQTSGEIRVYLERRAGKDLMGRAKKIFEKLGMTKTRHRNGVLIYFSLLERRFVILGDRGIHDKVGEDFWKEIVIRVQSYFTQDDFAGGLEAGIHEIGKRLKNYFLREIQDINELPDTMPE